MTILIVLLQALQLTVTPILPHHLRVMYKIPQHPENKYRSLVWTSATGLTGSSLSSMDGDNAAISYEQLLEVTPGLYRIEVCVYRSATNRLCTYKDILVPGEPATTD